MFQGGGIFPSARGVILEEEDERMAHLPHTAECRYETDLPRASTTFATTNIDTTCLHRARVATISF